MKDIIVVTVMILFLASAICIVSGCLWLQTVKGYDVNIPAWYEAFMNISFIICAVSLTAVLIIPKSWVEEPDVKH